MRAERGVDRPRRARWADRLAWVGTATDEKTGERLFPDGKLTEVPTHVKKMGRRKLRRAQGPTGLLFEGTNRKARRDAARSTRRRGH